MRTLDGKPIVLPKANHRNDLPWAAICKKDETAEIYTITFVSTDSTTWGIRDMNIGYFPEENGEVYGQLIELSRAEAGKIWKYLFDWYYGGNGFRGGDNRPIYTGDFPRFGVAWSLTVEDVIALEGIVYEKIRDPQPAIT